MDKNLIKIIGWIVGLVAIVAIILFIAIKGFSLGPINAVSIAEIATKKNEVKLEKAKLALAEVQYDNNLKSLDNAKKEFNTQKEAYELISDETIAAIKEATKEEEYFMEYLWIVLGNYASAHDLALAIVEPGGTVSQGATTTTTTTEDADGTQVSTGTGISGNSSGVTTNTNNNTKTDTENEDDTTEEQTTSITSGLTAAQNALTVQVRGSYIDLADFVFEVENDKSLRFRLDNIKMKSAGGTQVIASFNVKNFTVLKSLE